jgi:hypothetical protein
VIGSWLYHIFGLKGTGPFYGFLSGAGSDISELSAAASFLGAAVALLRRMVKHHAEQLAQAAKHHEALKAHLSGLLAESPAVVNVHVSGPAAGDTKAVAEQVRKNLADLKRRNGGTGP